MDSSILLLNGPADEATGQSGAEGASGVTAGKAALVSALHALLGPELRDVHVFTRGDHEALYLRDDVQANLEDVEVERYIDNERYGFVTQATYDDLHYTTFEFTVRGFTDFYQFRTFLNQGAPLGLLVSVDRTDRGVDFGAVQDRITTVVDTHGSAAFRPDQD